MTEPEIQTDEQPAKSGLFNVETPVQAPPKPNGEDKSDDDERGALPSPENEAEAEQPDPPETPEGDEPEDESEEALIAEELAAEDPEAGQEGLENIENVARRLDVDIDKLYEMEVPLGRDGQRPTLGELKNFAIEAVDTIKHYQTAATRWDEAAPKFEALIGKAEALLLRDFEGIESLRNEDPAEYSARHTDLERRKAEIEDLKKNARAQIESAQNSEEIQAANAQYVEQQKEKLFKRFPKFDEKEFVKDMVARGATPQQLATLQDAELIIALEESRLYRKAKAQAGKKRVSKPQKVLKPGPKIEKEPESKPLTAAETLFPSTRNQ